MLQLLCLRGCLISIDAMECQTEGAIFAQRKMSYIFSIEPDVQRFAESVRNHWSIENQLHWVIDVGFSEDDSQACQG